MTRADFLFPITVPFSLSFSLSRSFDERFGLIKYSFFSALNYESIEEEKKLNRNWYYLWAYGKIDNAKAVCSFKYSIDGNVEFVMWKLLEPRWIRLTYFFFYCSRWFLWMVLSAAESTINAGNAKKRWITSTDLVGLYSKSDGSGGWRRWL